MSFESLIYQMGDTEVWRLFNGIYTGRPYNKIFICPNCFESIHLGKDSETKKWTYKEENTILYNHTLACKTEKAFKTHINKCSSILNTGINRIDFNSDKIAHGIVDKLSKFSKNETKWDFQQVNKLDLSKKDKLIAYVFKNEVGPISFVAFRNETFILEGNKTVQTYYLCDLFTFPLFRKKGIATKLIKYGIKDLNIYPFHFPVSYPLTKMSCNIVKNICENEVFAVYNKEYRIIKKDDISA